MKKAPHSSPAKQTPGVITLVVSVLVLTAVLLCAAFPADRGQSVQKGWTTEKVKG